MSCNGSGLIHNYGGSKYVVMLGGSHKMPVWVTAPIASEQLVKCACKSEKGSGVRSNAINYEIIFFLSFNSSCDISPNDYVRHCATIWCKFLVRIFLFFVDFVVL